MLDSAPLLFTIGYSGFSIENFVSTLLKYRINAIVDVRAMPEISHFECYKRNNIKPILQENNIIYKFFGRVFGARPESRQFFSSGKVDFEKIKQNDEFQVTCHNLKTGLDKGKNICLMCAQKDPIICHRAILITDYFRYLYPEIPITHIMPDKVESQIELDKRVMALYRKKMYADSLLTVSQESSLTELQKAYIFQGREIAWDGRIGA